MRSAVAEAVRREQRERWAKLSPVELLRLTDTLTEGAIRELISARQIDRARRFASSSAREAWDGASRGVAMQLAPCP